VVFSAVCVLAARPAVLVPLYNAIFTALNALVGVGVILLVGVSFPVTSESGVRLSQITAIVRKGLDNKDFILSGIKGNSWTPGEAWFKIENARKISPITVEHAVKPMIFYLMSLREMVTEREFLKEFDEVPTIEEIDAEMKMIKAWAADPKNDEKKYTYGSDDDVLTCRKNKNGESTELRPVFNERAGVAVYISFSKDSEE
jgi:hypothetical protein